jgi:uncharacterized protein (DUF2141 family)
MIFQSLILVLMNLMFQSSPKGELQIQIENIKSNQGVIRLLLFDKEDGFPKENEKAIYQETVNIQNQKAVVTLKNLPFGKYAISVFHDSQNSGKLKTNAVGIPIDNYGFSNNASGSFGPPSFSKAAFEVKQSKVVHVIKLR